LRGSLLSPTRPLAAFRLARRRNPALLLFTHHHPHPCPLATPPHTTTTATTTRQQELFENRYWCQEQKAEYFSWAATVDASPSVQRMRLLAKELDVVLPVSFFERPHPGSPAFFNSVAVVDADGSIAGLYRKSHVPDGPGYQEKFYFSPGDTGFRVFETRHGRVGVGICWDQWFPETARCLALQGADVIFYPTAIGSEPHDPSVTSYRHWARTMLGHAAANLTPVVASNRVGVETFEKSEITFYGGSFIGGQEGEVVAQVGARAGANDEGALDPNPDTSAEGFCVATFDLDACSVKRAGWGVFRDRRPELYGPICTLDGAMVHRAVTHGASGEGLLVVKEEGGVKKRKGVEPGV
jgi:N-carbamoylputrescine amidase